MGSPELENGRTGASERSRNDPSKNGGGQQQKNGGILEGDKRERVGERRAW